jgi:hypothetical protein
MRMNDVDMGPTYASGEYPQVGDLIEFGTRHQRLLVTAIDIDGPRFSMDCGAHVYHEGSLRLMVLIARHGVEPRKVSNATQE